MKKKNFGLGILLAGCLILSLTGCSPSEIMDKILSKTDEVSQEETKETKEVIKVDVAKPELKADLSGSVNYLVGQEAEPLTVSASISDSGTLTYQWYRNTTNSNGGGTRIEDATAESYTPSTEEEGTTYYYCVATNTIGDSINGTTTGTVEVIVSTEPVTPVEEVVEEAKTGWQQDELGWWYGKEDGSYAANEWLELEGKQYCFDENGYARIGWYQEGEDWYYFNADRSMATDMEIDGYQLGSDGKLEGEREDTSE